MIGIGTQYARLLLTVVLSLSNKQLTNYIFFESSDVEEENFLIKIRELRNKKKVIGYVILLVNMYFSFDFFFFNKR